MPKYSIEEILFVDDSDDEAFVTNLLLQNEKIDLTIRHFWNYKALSTYIKANPTDKPCIVAIDLNMPGQKGTEVIEVLYSEHKSANVIAGIFSGSEDPKDREDSINAGAMFFIPKPMDRKFFNALCEKVPQISMVNSGVGKTSFNIVC